MMVDESEFGLFLDVLVDKIKDQLKYYRTYSAKVKIVADVMSEGRVALECQELLAKDPLSYIWALPVGNPRSFLQPKVDDNVILFFKDADVNQPKYLSEIQSDMIETMPLQNKYILMQAATFGSSLMCDDAAGGFTIESKSPAGSAAAIEKMVLGEKLKSLIDYILDSYIKDIYERLEKLDDDLMKHKHTAPTGPTSPALPPTPTNRAADKSAIAGKKANISAKKSEYAVPGNLLSIVNKNN